MILLHINNKGADQSALPRSLISALAVRSLEIMDSQLAIYDIARF